MRRRLALTTGALIAAGAALIGTAVPANAYYFIVWDWGSQFVSHLPTSATPPPGAENVSDGHKSTCNWKNSPDKLPLILVHGTWEQQSDNFQALSPYFKNEGFCVYTFNYGGNPGDTMWGWKSIANSAGEFGTYVNKVLASTGATKVDVVGHSQGGMMPRYYIKKLGGMSKVNKFVGLAASNNGTTLSGLAKLGKAIGITDPLSNVQPAAIDQTIGSDFQKAIDACPGTTALYNVCKGDTVKYWSIETEGDQVVTPYTNAFLTKQPGSTTSVTNIDVNKQCPLELAEHLGMSYSQNVASRALVALAPLGNFAICKTSTPYSGG
ncbi:alpha/beta fold hydrolase [Spongisporangium articulatum]|uniref:Alpha/beta fold hydrolase n=1 Tax=Spongisporangium articulatum TaxID=3362603 RepID=A0ABW8ARA9_9ACTN